MGIWMAILLKREFPLKTLIEMAVIGNQKCFSVIAILLLIRAVMAVWIAAEKVPVLVYRGIKSMTLSISFFGRLS
jgi:Na+/H+ antiporter NhaC